MADWNVFSSHGLVLVAIARNPNRTARDIGDEVGLDAPVITRLDPYGVSVTILPATNTNVANQRVPYNDVVTRAAS